jgi:hypothetical protein
MGMFSWMCKGDCGKPIKADEEVIEINSGPYGGYGHVGDGEHSGCIYHKVCFFKKFGDIDTSEGDYDPDQGMGYPDPEFLPAGTTLYESQYDVLKGVGKVGICIDVSGSMAFDLLRGGMQLLSGAEAAMHYLGIKEIEVITFDYIVQKQATMPVEQLGSVLFDHDGSWRKGGGGTDMRPPIEAAVKAGCGAIVVVGDLYGQLPEDPGVPVIWLCPVDSNLIEKNYDAGKRGQDCYDGAPKPPYGDITYFESYPVD